MKSISFFSTNPLNDHPLVVVSYRHCLFVVTLFRNFGIRATNHLHEDVIMIVYDPQILISLFCESERAS